jgi:hypothetical protein
MELQYYYAGLAHGLIVGIAIMLLFCGVRTKIYG